VRTRLIFVRHGEALHTIDAVVGGPRGCRGLTALGHEQARTLADRLADDLAGDGQVAVYSSTLRRAIETAQPIAASFATTPRQDCGLCTWHVPSYADGMPTSRFQAEHAVVGGGVFRPFEEGNESWAELVLRTSQAIMGIAHRHHGSTVVLVGHSETVESSFHALGAQPLYRAFDTRVAPASVTEWVTDGNPTSWPPPRWTLHRFSASSLSP
jgi:broad specificity phosphatase PhoE